MAVTVVILGQWDSIILVSACLRISFDFIVLISFRFSFFFGVLRRHCFVFMAFLDYFRS